MLSADQKITEPNLYKAFGLMKQKEYDAADKLLTEGLASAEKAKDLVMSGVYLSTLGLLYKLKKEFRKAWKCYEKAEKILPADPALKLISARLLLDYFGQNDTVIKKMDQVLKVAADDFTVAHQALTVKGIAYLRKGDKKKASEYLEKTIGNDFRGLQTPVNLDYQLVCEMVRKNWDIPMCRKFLEKALAFAKSVREKSSVSLIEVMIKKLP